MSFLSTESLKNEMESLVGNKEHPVDIMAVVLHVGHEVFITGNSTKRVLNEKEQFSIPPGQFALLITEEKVDLLRTRLGFITIKFGLKKKGLINISGFHVDPGFKGKILFSVYNAGPNDIPLSRGADAFRMWISKIDGEAEEYKGTHLDQDCISDSDVSMLLGHIASPAALQKQLDDNKQELQGQVNDIKKTLGKYKWVASVLLIPFLLGVIFLMLSHLMSSKVDPKGNQSVMVVQGRAGDAVCLDSLGVILADSVIVFRPSGKNLNETNEGDKNGNKGKSSEGP